MSDQSSISHAVVLPDRNFTSWLQAVVPYMKAFERVFVVRSPAGNDLNRYRNITAVEAPLTWYKDSAYEHIRRFYPTVVRIDTIKVQTPDQLKAALQTRINTQDRYGENQNGGAHIHDRFILEWPTTYTPMRIINKFRDAPGVDDDTEGIDIASKAGAKIISSTAGTLTRIWSSDKPDDLGYANYIQVTSSQGGFTYVVSYVGVKQVQLPLGSEIRVGDHLANAMLDSFRLVVQRPGGGKTGFAIPDIIDPTPLIYIPDFRLTPTVNGLRVRHLPDTKDGRVLGEVHTFDMLETIESQGRALGKLDVNGEWIRVRMPNGVEGYTAAWYLRATQKGALDSKFAGVNPVGVNLDQLHPLGTPDPSRLGEIGWVRFGYNVSNNSGSEDIGAAYNRYAPLLEKYVNAGYKVCMTTSHQTYGEGKNEFWPWPSMDDQKWSVLIPRFADMMHRITQQYAGKGLIHCWQVWNEQDAPIGAVASVPMLAHNYAKMMTETIRAVRAADSDILVITGGHTGGPDRGGQYARDTLNSMPFDVRPDGIAFHPYGRGLNPGGRYAVFGHIDESVQKYGAIMPDKPLWMTEWGVLDKGGDSPNDISNYAINMIRHLKSKYPGRIAAMIWYAWAESMHNGYGIVDTSGNPRPPFTQNFLSA